MHHAGPEGEREQEEALGLLASILLINHTE